MPIYSSAGDSKAFEPAPEGLWPVVCVDVVDKGIVQTQWGPKNKVQFRWQLGESAGVRDDGQPWLVVRQFNNTLFKLADLCKFLTRWRGHAFIDEELKQFDLEAVLGAVGLANIVHHEADDGTVYANVDTILPLPKQMPKPIGNYIRQQDREQMAGNGRLTPDLKQDATALDDDFSQALEEQGKNMEGWLGKVQEQALPASPQPPKAVSTGETRAARYMTILEELDFDGPTKMVELVQKSRPGKTFLTCTEADQELFIAAALKALKKKLDAQAAKEESN